jgi:dTMP kinase
MNPKGIMIVVDGGNGAGKSSVLRELLAHLTNKGVSCEFSREPGGTPISEKVRDILLDPDNEGMTDTTELLLFAAARAQHVEQLIKPALASGKVVVCDRFDSATFAFQHYARGIDYDLVGRTNDIALNGFSPDMTIILDIDVKLGVERIHGRGEGLDRLDAENFNFLERARAGYLEQATKSPDKFRVVDASQSQQQVFDDVKALVDELLSQHR